MADESSPSRFKAEMPQIPGISREASHAPRHSAITLLSLIAGVIVFGVVLLFAVRWFNHSRHIASTHLEPAPQLEVPAAPPDPKSLMPHADKNNPVIAQISELAQPWSSVDFFIRDITSGENVPATIVRLPSGSPTSTSGYWAFSRKAPYGDCDLEYVRDLNALRNGYDFQQAKHPLVGNPCSHTLYDPLQTASLPGNIWIRGAIVQGSDIRPPFGVEIKLQGKQILAIRTE
jgi:hypothetical protein